MAKQTITAKVEQGKLVLGLVAKEALKQRLAKFEGEYVSLDVKSLSSKTNPQLGYYFAVVLPILIQGMDELGWTDDDDKRFNLDTGDKEVKKICAKQEDGTIMDKTDMSIEDFNKFLDNAIRWGTSKLHVYIPEATKGKRG